MCQSGAVILMYHQVCDKRYDPWGLAVHPDHFDTQLDYLKKNLDVVPVEELAEGARKFRRKATIAITFDDGFRDNYTNAAPILDWHQLPATFYVATRAMKQDHIYWWDTLQDIVFDSEILPVRFDMMVNDTPVQFTFRSDRVLTDKVRNQIRAWSYSLPIPNERVALYMLLWRLVRPLRYAQQNGIITAIRQWADYKTFSTQQSTTMSVREMQMLSQNPLFTVGAHSVHHAMLSRQNPVDQAYEVKESKVEIEKWTGKPVTGFAYPYGDYNAVTQTLLREAGFRYAVSTEPKAVSTGDDPFALPRIPVRNWSVCEFASKLNTW